MQTELSQSSGHCWVFQIYWHIKCSTFTASSFRILNSSAEIPSPPISLFVVMLPKVRSASHSRMSGSRWVVTSPWLSVSVTSLLYSSSYHLFLILFYSNTKLSFHTKLNTWYKVQKIIKEQILLNVIHTCNQMFVVYPEFSPSIISTN